MEFIKKIKIGTLQSPLAIWNAKYARKVLATIGVDSELIFVENTEKSLLLGDVDMVAHPMKNLPTTLPDGLVITAVAARMNPAVFLIIGKKAVDATMDFSLKTNAVIGVVAPTRKAQILNFRKDLNIKNTTGDAMTRLGALKNGAVDAIFLAAATLEKLNIDLSEFKVIPFNVREFVPIPAQGVLAYQTCKSDTATRRILKKIHHPEVSQVTNVERKILKRFGENASKIAAYCEKDNHGNYHLWVSKSNAENNMVKKIRLSSSTNYQLEDSVFKMLET